MRFAFGQVRFVFGMARIIFHLDRTINKFQVGTFLDIDEKILNYLKQVERGGFDLKL